MDGWNFDKNELVMSNGIIPALYEMVEYICKPDEKVLFLTPSYAYFKYAADFNKREYICSDQVYNEGYYTIDFDDFEKKAAEEKTTLFIFCHPHNPSGRIWREDELKKLAKIIERYHLWVISDEIHCDLIRLHQKHIPMGKIMPDYQRLITAMAPSKTFNLAGMMISNLIIRDEKILKLAHDTESPIFSYNSEIELSAVVNLVYLAARDRYHIEREDKAGEGYVDFIFYPERKGAEALILELKVDSTPADAIEQIKNKNYILRFKGKMGEKPKYTGGILAVGISYNRKTKKHSCKVEELSK